MYKRLVSMILVVVVIRIMMMMIFPLDCSVVWDAIVQLQDECFQMGRLDGFSLLRLMLMLLMQPSVYLVILIMKV